MMISLGRDPPDQLTGSIEQRPLGPGQPSASNSSRLREPWEGLELLDTFAAGLGCASLGGGVEHALQDGRVLRPVGAIAELSGDVDGGDGRDGLDAVIGSSRRERRAGGA